MLRACRICLSNQALQTALVHSRDCVHFVPVDYDSTAAFTRNFLAPRSFDRSCVAKFFRRRVIFSSPRFFLRSRQNFRKKSLGRRVRFHPKIMDIGAILAIFKPFQVLKIHMPLLGEFSRSSHDLRNLILTRTNPGTIG